MDEHQWKTYGPNDMAKCPKCGGGLLEAARGTTLRVRAWSADLARSTGAVRLQCRGNKCKTLVQIVVLRDMAA